MSCFSFNKLFPAKKTWKKFSFKFQGKLDKSKVIKKNKWSRKKTSKKKISWANFCIFKSKNPSKTVSTTSSYKYYFQKTASPVYIDQLFIEPVVSGVKAATSSSHCQSTVTLKANKKKRKKKEQGNSSSTSSAKRLVDMVGGTSRDDDDEEEVYSHSVVDDMWESMAMSPQMNEINERAEEFIASFRAEMQLQELIARDL